MTRKPTKNRRPIHFVVRRVFDPVSDGIVGALVPASSVDARAMRERKYHVGSQLRADLSKPRNVVQWRLAHALGGWMAENVDGFESLSQHEALKQLQRECGVHCDAREIDLGELGRVVVKEARSLSFDDMEQGEFDVFWQAVTEYVRDVYARGLTEMQWAQVLELIQREAA